MKGKFIMKEKLIKLIDLKSIITIAMAITLVVGFFKGLISAEVFIPFATMTFTFYFTKKDSDK
jgi:hypothetical protein